jgi:hypothetical protein
MKLKSSPKQGDERRIVRFLWTPFEIDGDKRWLEKVCYLEIYEREGVFDLFGLTPLVWKPKFFIERCQYCENGILWDGLNDKWFTCSECKGTGWEH